MTATDKNNTPARAPSIIQLGQRVLAVIALVSAGILVVWLWISWEQTRSAQIARMTTTVKLLAAHADHYFASVGNKLETVARQLEDVNPQRDPRRVTALLRAAKAGNPDATFNDIHNQMDRKGFRELFFVGTNLSTRFAEVFSYEHTPRWCVADAVRISMSIPLFFAAKRSMRGDVYVDGGLIDNYPIKVFDREKYVDDKTLVRTPPYYATHNDALKAQGRDINPYVYNVETLGFRLDSAKEIAVFRDQAEPEHRQIDDFFSYLWALVGTVMETQSSQHLHSDDWQRTIYIDTLGVGTTDFDLSDERKAALAESGKTHTEKYFAWYDDPTSQPANRPGAVGSPASPREAPKAPRTPSAGRARTAIRRRRS